MYQLAEFISKLCTTRKISSKINTCVLILISHNFLSWWNGLKLSKLCPLILGLCQCLSTFVIILFQNITQNYLVVIFSNFLRFSCLYCSCLAQLLDIFSLEISRQAQFWKKYAGIILMTYANALTLTRSYWEYNILIITPFKRFLIN